METAGASQEVLGIPAPAGLAGAERMDAEIPRSSSSDSSSSDSSSSDSSSSDSSSSSSSDESTASSAPSATSLTRRKTTAVASVARPTAASVATKVAPRPRGTKQQTRWLVSDERRERRIKELRRTLRAKMEDAGVDLPKDGDLVDDDLSEGLLNAARVAITATEAGRAVLASLEGRSGDGVVATVPALDPAEQRPVPSPASGAPSASTLRRIPMQPRDGDNQIALMDCEADVPGLPPRSSLDVDAPDAAAPVVAPSAFSGAEGPGEEVTRPGSRSPARDPASSLSDASSSSSSSSSSGGSESDGSSPAAGGAVFDIKRAMSSIRIRVAGVTDTWRFLRLGLMRRLADRLSKLDAAVRDRALAEERARAQRQSALAESAVMKHAKGLLSGIDARARLGAHARMTGAPPPGVVWGSKVAHPAAMQQQISTAHLPNSGPSRLPGVTLPIVSLLLGEAPTARLQSAPAARPVAMVDDGDDDLDIVDELPPTLSCVPGANSATEPALPSVLAAMQRLQSEFELRDEALRQLHRRAADEERRRVAELRSKKSALQASRQRRRGADDVGAYDDEDCAEADALLLSDFLPSLLNDMVALVGGFGVVADGPVAAALSGASGRGGRSALPALSGAGSSFDAGSLSDLLVSAAAQDKLAARITRGAAPQKESRLRAPDGHSAAAAAAASGGGTGQALRRAMREQLSAAQRRQSSQLDARRRGFGSIVQLGVAKARRSLKKQYEERAALLADALQRARDADPTAAASFDEGLGSASQLPSVPLEAVVAAVAVVEDEPSGAAPALLAASSSPKVLRTYGKLVPGPTLASPPLACAEAGNDVGNLSKELIPEAAPPAVGAQPPPTLSFELDSETDEPGGSLTGCALAAAAAAAAPIRPASSPATLESSSGDAGSDGDADDAMPPEEAAVGSSQGDAEAASEERRPRRLRRLRKSLAASASGSDGEDSDAASSGPASGSPSKKRTRDASSSLVADAAEQRKRSKETFLEILQRDQQQMRGKSAGGGGYLDTEADLEEEEDGAQGVNAFGASQRLLGSDGRLVTRLVEDLEERRAAGEGLTDGELAAELGGHIVDELSDDERALDGGQAALQSELNRQRDEKETNQLMRAVATGKLALMRGAARRGGAGLSSFSRNVADVDDEDEDAEAEGDEEARLAAEEEARLGEGESVLRDDDEDEDNRSGGLTGASKTEDEDEDGAFDFEAEMAARVAEQSRRDRASAAAGGRAGPAGARGLLHADSATLAAQLLGDDEDSEALLAKMRMQTQPARKLASAPPVPGLQLMRQPSASAASTLGLGRTALPTRGLTTANPLDAQHLRQQEQIAPMRMRTAAPGSAQEAARACGGNLQRVPPAVAAATGAKPGSVLVAAGESKSSVYGALTTGTPRGSPPGSAPVVSGPPAPPAGRDVARSDSLTGRTSEGDRASRVPLAVLAPEHAAALAPASVPSARDTAGCGGACSRPGSDPATKAGAVGFMAAAAGSAVRRSDSGVCGGGPGSSSSTLGGATFAGSKSLLAQQGQLGGMGLPGGAAAAPFVFSAAASKAGVAAGGLVSVTTGKHVVFAGADDASRSRAGFGVGQASMLPGATGDASSRGAAALCRAGSGSRGATGGPQGAVSAPASFAGTPSLFSVLKRT